jgi:DNA-binding GntR family transcriptional regulator
MINPPEIDEAIQHRPLKATIFDFLHKRIIAGNYPPGEWLRQEEIASQLGVSQTPVREALDLLVSSGLAERVPYRGVRVLQLSSEEIADSYALRLLLESYAARLAAINRTDAQVEELTRLLEAMRPPVNLNDMSNQRQLNQEFHLLLVEASGNALLTRLYGMVFNKFPDWMLYEYMFRHPELLQDSLAKEYDEHKAIAEAVASSDEDRTTQQVIAHIHNRSRELVAYLGVPAGLLAARTQQLGALMRSKSD